MQKAAYLKTAVVYLRPFRSVIVIEPSEMGLIDNKFQLVIVNQ